MTNNISVLHLDIDWIWSAQVCPVRRRLGGGGPDGLVALHLAHHQQAEAARLPRGRQEPRQQQQQGGR